MATDNNFNNSNTGQNSGWKDYMNNRSNSSNTMYGTAANVAGSAGLAYTQASGPNMIESPEGLENNPYQSDVDKMNRDKSRMNAADDTMNSTMSNFGWIGGIHNAADGINQSVADQQDNQADYEAARSYSPTGGITMGVNALQNGDYVDAGLSLFTGSSPVKHALTLMGYKSKAAKAQDKLEADMKEAKLSQDMLAFQKKSSDNAIHENRVHDNRINSMYGNNTMGGEGPLYGAYGGSLPQYDNKVDVIENGGIHEANPLGGVPIGMGNAKLEEGEVRWNDYVFSDRLY